MRVEVTLKMSLMFLDCLDISVSEQDGGYHFQKEFVWQNIE